MTYTDNILSSLGVAAQLEKTFNAANIISKIDPFSQQRKMYAQINQQLNMLRSPFQDIGQRVIDMVRMNDMAVSLAAFDKSYLAGFKMPDILTRATMFPDNVMTQVAALCENSRRLAGFMDASMVARMPDIFYAKNSLQRSLGTISSALTSYAAISKDYDFIEQFNEINKDAVTLGEEAIEQNLSASEFLQKVEAFIINLIARFKRTLSREKIRNNPSLRARLFEWMALIGFILTVLGTVLAFIALKPNKEMATKADLRQLGNSISQQIISVSCLVKGVQKEFWVTDRKCAVYNNAKMKSIVQDSIGAFCSVNVVMTRHKWQYVTYTDPIDTLPRAGWVMKKYLHKITPPQQVKFGK